ncbi:MAG: 1-acyl-sn-glycerol-3-phosphate acyltransferase [Nitrospirae bacterium]|nr:1-acyl-sn-glycerol-3-phosphate acyltransferase [Nitrospirota bacterium]
MQSRRLISDFFYRFFSLVIRIILRINGGLEVIGRENIPLEGGVIIAANHVSYLDPPLIGSVLPRRGTFIAMKELFDMPLLGRVIRHYAFPVEEGGTRPSVIKKTISRLRAGELITIFPEGQRSVTGKLLKAKRGIGMLASMSNAPVVPALITGANIALPFNAKWLRRARISVIFGRPVYPVMAEGADNKNEGYEKISDQVMSAIREIKERYGDNSS